MRESDKEKLMAFTLIIKLVFFDQKVSILEEVKNVVERTKELDDEKKKKDLDDAFGTKDFEQCGQALDKIRQMLKAPLLISFVPHQSVSL